MSDDIEALLEAGTRPRKSVLRFRDLFGDTDLFPVFRDMSALCDVFVRNRSQAWPMRFSLPSAPPDPPDFAGLVCVYCNHLAHVLTPHLGDAVRKEPPPASGVMHLLTFLLLSAHSLSRALPTAAPATAYLERVKGKLLESVRIIRPDDEPYWELVASACDKAVCVCNDKQSPDNKPLFDELAGYLSMLVQLERSAQNEALISAYRHGAQLVEQVARRFQIDMGAG